MGACLASLSSSVPDESDDVMLSQDGGVMLALEGGVIVPWACAALRGWLVDEADKVRALYLHLDGELREIRPVTRIFRQDVNAYARPAQPGYEAGFTALEWMESAPATPQAARLAALIEGDGQFRLLVSGRWLAVSQSHHADRVLDEVAAAAWSPEQMAEHAGPSLRRLAVAARRSSWPPARRDVAGSNVADATLIMVVDRNIEMLGPWLALLEMEPEHRRLGVVIVFSRPEHAEGGAAAIRDFRATSGFAFISHLAPGRPVTFGAALGRALAAAEGETVIVCTDDALPPAGSWLGQAMALSVASPNAVLVPSRVSFDGRADTTAGLLDELPMERFANDHSGVVTEVASLLAERLGGLGAGVVVAQRARLGNGQIFDDAYTDPEFAFADAFLRLAKEDAASLQPIDLTFTALTLPEHHTGNPALALWNAYALADVLKASREPQASEPSPLGFDPG